MIKDKWIQVRVTQEEKDLIEKEAHSIGLTVAAFILLLIRQFSNGITFERKDKAS